MLDRPVCQQITPGSFSKARDIPYPIICNECVYSHHHCFYIKPSGKYVYVEYVVVIEIHLIIE